MENSTEVKQEAKAPLVALGYDPNAAKLKVNQKMKLDIRGPVILNSNGTMSRIAGWENLSQLEKDRAWRLMVKRNMVRKDKLEKNVLAQKQLEKATQARLTELMEQRKREDALPLPPELIAEFHQFISLFLSKFPQLPSYLAEQFNKLIENLDRRLIRAYQGLKIDILDRYESGGESEGSELLGDLTSIDSQVIIDNILVIPLEDIQRVIYNKVIPDINSENAKGITLIILTTLITFKE